MAEEIGDDELVENTEEVADAVMMSIDEFAGKKPSGVATSVVYVAKLLCDDPEAYPPQSAIAKRGGVAAPTVRKSYREIHEVYEDA